jgi:hypothetical protein
VLLPRELRPGVVPSLCLIVGGLFFWMLGIVSVLDQLQRVGWIRL